LQQDKGIEYQQRKENAHVLIIEEERYIISSMVKGKRKWIGHMLRGWRPTAKNGCQDKDGGNEKRRRSRQLDVIKGDGCE